MKSKKATEKKAAAPKAAARQVAKLPLSTTAAPKSAVAKKKPIPAASVKPSAPPTKLPRITPAASKPAPRKAAVRKPVAKAKTQIEVPAILLEGDNPPPPLVQGPGQRYALGLGTPVEHLPAGELGELPEAYGTKKLFLAARDPQWVYAHWDLTRAQQVEYNQLAAEGHLALRVFINAFGGRPSVEVPVHPESRNWFIHVGRGGTKCLAELGYYNAKQKWVSISKSGATLTPPDSLSEDTSVRFATLPVEVSFQDLLAAVKAAAQEHLPLAEALREIARACYESAGAEQQAGAFSPSHAKEIFEVLEAGSWTPEQEQALAQIISMDEVRRVWIGSLEITELVRRHLQRDVSSAGAAQFGQAQPVQPGAGLGVLGSLTSPFGGGGAKAKGFWFNVNAELVVYGATEPDAEVTIGGRVIKLRPDGTFSYRFALPDGQYELPIVAVSADKTDGRAAELQFRRQTEYRGEVGVHPQDAALKAPQPENVS
ncbi:MAG: DUF4912 domain-containing protein [Verrucomicrobiota bacterium]